MAWDKTEVTRQVYSHTIAYLRAESQVDIDDPAFIELAVKAQERIAKQLEMDMLAALNGGFVPRKYPEIKCGCRMVHTCGAIT